MRTFKAKLLFSCVTASHILVPGVVSLQGQDFVLALYNFTKTKKYLPAYTKCHNSVCGQLLTDDEHSFHSDFNFCIMINIIYIIL